VPNPTARIKLAALPPEPQPEAEVDILMVTEIAFLKSSDFKEKVPGIKRRRSARGKALAGRRGLPNTAPEPASPRVTESEIAIPRSVQKRVVIQGKLERSDNSMGGPLADGPQERGDPVWGRLRVRIKKSDPCPARLSRRKIVAASKAVIDHLTQNPQALRTIRDPFN
jgi:hypothetical protein